MNRRLGALWALALIAGGGSVALVLASHHESSPALAATFVLLIGLSFVASGLIAWARRPENPVGKLMVAVGFVSFLGALADANNSYLFTVGVVFGNASLALFGHLLLAFPSGRLETRFQRILAGLLYVDLIALQLLWMLFADFRETGCEDCVTGGIHEPADLATNEFLVARSDWFADAVELTQNMVGIGLAAAVVGVLVQRWRRATRPARRALTPVFVAGGVTLFLFLVVLFTFVFWADAAASIRWVAFGTYASVPLAFLVGLLRSRLARIPAGRLLLEVPRDPSLADIQQGLRHVLRDPTLRLGFCLPETDGYVDVEGKPFEPPPDGPTAVTTRVEYGGRPLAVLVHDPSLRDEPDLLDEVIATARVALERDQTLQGLRVMEARNRALLDALPDLMFRMSEDGRYLDAKSDDQDALAAPARQMIGQNIYDVLPHDVADRIMNCARSAREGGSVQSVDYQLTRDGVTRDFEARIVPAGEDEYLLIVRDFTERTRTEKELRRLQDELRARLEELQASRTRIVEAGDAERRRLERNLHDGAQQRLVALMIALRLARRNLDKDPGTAEQLLSGAEEELERALEDLRELARGIHPAILTDRGLNAAVRALAVRSPVPVEVETPDERLPDRVEAAVYYVVSETLANVAKYANASKVDVRVWRDDGRAIVEVADDGVGGADPRRGSGLRGLVDRVEALHGRLEVESPPQAGTRVTAEIPCP